MPVFDLGHAEVGGVAHGAGGHALLEPRQKGIIIIIIIEMIVIVTVVVVVVVVVVIVIVMIIVVGHAFLEPRQRGSCFGAPRNLKFTLIHPKNNNI